MFHMRSLTTEPTPSRAPSATGKIPARFRASRASRTSRASRASAAAGLVLLAVCAGVFSGVLPAQAAGNASLDHLIVTNPEPGWASLSSSELNTFQSDVQNELTGKGSTQTFATAVEGWQSPQGFSTASLVIFLVQALTGSVGGTASDEATGFCNGATGQTPTSAQPISGVSDGATTTCSGEGEDVTVGSGITGNYLTLVASFGSSPLPASTIGPIVSNQVAAVNNSQSSGSGSTANSGSASSSSSLPIIAGAGGGAVVVIAVVIFFLLRRRNSQLAGATPGQGSVPAYMQGPPGQTGFDPSSPPPGPAPGPALGQFGGPGVGLPPSAPAAAAAGQPRVDTAPSYPSASYQSVPAAPQSHDPWGDSDPGWLSSHEAAEASAAQVGTAPGGSAPSGVAPVASQAAGQDGTQGAQAPGWYPEGDDPSTMRYWDGSAFTSRRRWDGSNWVDA
jgi:hypothetical protein